ncbi:MAG: aldehyde dehydrogenase [Phycisphaerales bacterium]|nr:aldehyde dehydrogenase [Phycisphaerales bacterium]
MTTMTATPPRPSRRTAPAPYDGFDKMLISGTWREGRSGRIAEDRDPYTNEVLVRIPQADQRDLDEANRSAAAAQTEWNAVLPRERAAVLTRAAEIMEERREEIVDWLIRESGSTRIKAGLELDYARGITFESATFPSWADGHIVPTDIPGKESRVYRQPVGVVGMISPWNFPLHLSMRSVAPALALGNGVVIKPASDTPVTGGLLLAKIFEEAGLPPGLLNVIIAHGSEIGDAFITHPVPRVISFTGSTEVGKHIAELAAKSEVLKKVALELGGNSPTVVLDDADVELAVNVAVFGKFLHQGQICMAINRLIVDAKVYDEFVDRFTDRVSKLKVGNPSDDDTVVGPVINQQQMNSHLKHIEKARAEGARQVLGGEPQGLVLPPHVFVDVTNDMSIAQEELFGPIAPVIKVRGDQEALAAANGTSYGLSASVVTSDVERGNEFAKRIQAGMTHVNDSPVNDLPTCPFGGEKNSGLGRYNGRWAIEEFTTVHWISVQHAPPQYPF